MVGCVARQLIGTPGIGRLRSAIGINYDIIAKFAPDTLSIIFGKQLIEPTGAYTGIAAALCTAFNNNFPIYRVIRAQISHCSFINLQIAAAATGCQIICQDIGGTIRPDSHITKIKAITLDVFRQYYRFRFLIQNIIVNRGQSYSRFTIAVSYILVTADTCMQQYIIIIVQFNRVRITCTAGIINIFQTTVILYLILHNYTVIIRIITTLRIDADNYIKLSVFDNHAFAMHPARRTVTHAAVIIKILHQITGFADLFGQNILIVLYNADCT